MSRYFFNILIVLVIGIAYLSASTANGQAENIYHSTKTKYLEKINKKREAIEINNTLLEFAKSKSLGTSESAKAAAKHVSFRLAIHGIDTGYLNSLRNKGINVARVLPGPDKNPKISTQVQALMNEYVIIGEVSDVVMTEKSQDNLRSSIHIRPIRILKGPEPYPSEFIVRQFTGVEEGGGRATLTGEIDPFAKSVVGKKYLLFISSKVYSMRYGENGNYYHLNERYEMKNEEVLNVGLPGWFESTKELIEAIEKMEV